MKSALYVVNKSENGRMLQDIAKSLLEIELMEWDMVGEVRPYDIIVLDWGPDTSICTERVVKLRSLCGFKDIAIILAADKNELSDAGDGLRCGANGIIVRPFNKSTVLQTLENVIMSADGRETINPEVINPFIDATVDVITTMTEIKVVNSEVYLKRSHALFGDISGVMSLSGDIEGLVAITFQNELGHYLVSRMVNCDESELTTEDVHDGVGELINVISGSAKAALNKIGLKSSIAIPTVIIGHGHQVTHPRALPLIIMIFEVDRQPFALQLCVSSNKISLLSEISKEGDIVRLSDVIV